MSTSDLIHEVSVLKLSLHDRRVGYLVGFRDGRNVLNFAEEFRNDPDRPTLACDQAPP